MKKNLTQVLALILSMLLLFSLAGCGSSSGGSSSNASSKSSSEAQIPEKKEPVKLSLWHIWNTDSDGNTAAFRNVLENFKKENSDIVIEATGQSNNDYYTKLTVAVSANEAPDIIYSQGLGCLKPYVDGGKLLPLDDLIAKNGTTDKLVGGTLANFAFDGKTYALPTSMAIGVLYCNKELFEKNGVKLPDTYNDLMDAVKAFSAKGITPIVVAGKDQWPAMFYYDIFAIRSAGVQACVDALNKKTSYDQPAFIDAAAKLQELAKNKAFNDSMMALGWDEAQQNFVQQKAAMLYNGSWVSGLCEKDDSPVKGKIVARKFPVIDGGTGKDTEFFGGALDCFAINALVKDKDAAFKATQWICSAMAKESYITGSGLPAWKIGEVDTSKINPLIVQQADLIKDATGFCAWWDTFLGGKNADTHKQLVLQLLSSKITPEQFVKEMQKQVNEAK